MKKTALQKAFKVGVLDLKGDVIEHRRALEACGAAAVSVKTPEDLRTAEALVIPGGESTTLARLMKWAGLDEAICARAQKGMPIYGTCAGAILLAKEVAGKEGVPTLGLMDIEVERNAYGRQVDSFEEEVELLVNLENKEAKGGNRDTSLRSCLFIRAPRIIRAGKNVEVLAQCHGDAVLAQQGNLLVSTFHPELTPDLTLHRYFLTFLTHV